ncbi:hypothetical protein MUN89_06865 [Halobacillus salinarum]|uniref:Uncharacterized protein n=1 Tax=Halobacillus salinarum TaxID=2932257 RepID=A0ABY4ENU0_9BACI|nr:hypothetical protein [Halobacillus salinarum]UOQ45650.1 hypothetical protein MUN89_06865 [Halobacillus salinarum]
MAANHRTSFITKDGREFTSEAEAKKYVHNRRSQTIFGKILNQLVSKIK